VVEREEEGAGERVELRRKCDVQLSYAVGGGGLRSILLHSNQRALLSTLGDHPCTGFERTAFSCFSQFSNDFGVSFDGHL
jgi:hypothetical protein